MAAQVAHALRFIDAVSAAGVGLGLALIWDVLRLLAGKGKLRLFFCDIMVFLLAGVLLVSFSVSKTYSGQLRWYMIAGALIGFVSYIQLVAPATKSVFELVCTLLKLPFVLTFRYILSPAGKLVKDKAQKAGKSFTVAAKNRRKHLRSKNKVLYNSK